LCSAFESESTIFRGVIIYCGIEDGVELSPVAEDGEPIEAGDGTT